MIRAQLLRADGVLVVEPRGALEAADFERLRLLLEPHLRDAGRLEGLLVFAEAFSGWEDFAAMLANLRFVGDLQHHLRRVALLGDDAVTHLAKPLGDWLVDAEIRDFAFADREQAEAWLRGAPPQAVSPT